MLAKNIPENGEEYALEAVIAAAGRSLGFNGSYIYMCVISITKERHVSEKNVTQWILTSYTFL